MPRRRTLDDGTYIIGRGGHAKIVLPYPEISERHALLLLRGDVARIEDMHSANGTYVNGAPIDGLVTLEADAVVQIGDCMLRISPVGAETPDKEPPVQEVAPDRPVASQPQPEPPDMKQAVIRRKAREQIQKELIARLDLKRLTVAGVDRAGLERQAKEKIHEIVGPIPQGLFYQFCLADSASACYDNKLRKSMR